MAIPLSSRTRRSMGPALGRARIPVITTVVSAIVHAALAAAVMLTASAWAARQPKVYVINLVPAVAARGAPDVRPTPAPALPPRPDEVAPRAAPTPPADLPARETASPDMPPRDAARSASALPDRTVPARRPALPRAGDKELPTVPSLPSTKPTPVPAPTAPPLPQTAAAQPPLGRPSGSALGSGAVTLNVSDFPFAWYTSALHRKITEQWSARALEGRQPIAVFEIGRTGQVSKLSIERSSGNPYYDQAALRAITGANPFPPLPEDYKEPFLRIHVGFDFARERG